MSYAMEEMTADMGVAMHADAGSNSLNIGSPSDFRIVRSGARPIRFSGSELAMAMSFTPEIPYWYEINLYRSVDAKFVAAVRHFACSEDHRDTVEAWEFESLDEALTAIKDYDAALDVEVAMPDGNTTPCGAEIASRALELRARIETKRQHYRGLVGEILYELDTL